MNLAAYVRDSGGEAQELSTAQQETALREWAVEGGHVIIHWFRDDARPGSSAVGRDGFQAMMAHFRAGAPEAGVVVWSMSRWSRDIDDSQFYRADLRRRGYDLISVTDSIPEGPMGRLFEAVLDWKAEQFLLDMSNDVRRGLASLVRQYGAMPGTPPRGFRRIPVELPDRRDGHRHIGHRWEPDPDLIPVVQRAFTMRADGASLADIQRETGLYKSLNCYKTFFSNRLYIGILDYGDQVIEAYCTSLIDRATWDIVQGISARHARHINLAEGDELQPRRIASRYLLSGLAVCARCGAPLFGAGSGRGYNRIYDRYACAAAVRRRDCYLKLIPRKILEDAVLHTVREDILTIVNLDMVQEAARQQAQSAAADHAGRVKELHAQLAILRRKIANVAGAIAETGPGRALTAKLRELETAESEALGRLARLESSYPETILTDPARIIAWAASRLDDPDQARTILRGLVSRVAVDRDGIHITGKIDYYYPPT